MKEFIDKLIERLEEKEKYYHGCALCEVLENGHTLDAEGFLGKEDTYDEALSIINQIAEEYNNDFCEWKYHRTINDVPMYATSCLHEIEERFVKNYKFCPYCGKKIKVVE